MAISRKKQHKHRKNGNYEKKNYNNGKTILEFYSELGNDHYLLVCKLKENWMAKQRHTITNIMKPFEKIKTYNLQNDEIWKA